MFVGNDRKAWRERSQQFSRFEQEGRIFRAPEFLIAPGERIEDQNTTVSESFNQQWEMWPVQVIDNGDAIEFSIIERPRVLFQVGCDNLYLLLIAKFRDP